ncbi:winged helix-turn-helix domain-containing protein [Streptomyces virginiae]|uniref:helix-turn-helix domain-containing protein n=1 Tax=Streptomyces virginiae TaxID=1961 RepID=UPI0035DF23FD
MSAVAVPAAVMLPAPRRAVDNAVTVLPELFVAEASQWLSTSSGRIAGEGYSWMQAVHWVAGSGLYQPRRHRSHGPRSFGPTTVRVAQELAALSPCRPGIKYLMRRTGLSERSVEYHLAMLREAGLLAYVVRGTRVRGEAAQASEFARMVPLEFDVALGIRTAGEGTGRRMTGIAEAGRELMVKLAKKAGRKLRRPRAKTSAKALAVGSVEGSAESVSTAVSAGGRCTPMEGGSTGTSSAGSTSLPPESKLASGKSDCPTRKRSKAKVDGRRLNRVGRRYQLAQELTQELDWLRGCSVPRIAWVARTLADAGWSVTEVKAWLNLRGETGRVHRGSGLLAVLLAGAEKILDTPGKRADAVEQWRGAQEAARRHRIQQFRARAERFDGDWDAPTSRAVQRQVNEAFTAAFGPKPQQAAPEAEVPTDVSGVEDLEATEVALARTEARQRLMQGNSSLITVAVDAMGREAAEQLYGPDLVRRGLQLASGARSSLMTYGRW